MVKSKEIVNYVRPKKPERQGLIHKANDWVLLADIGDSKLIFPVHIACTEERPDIIIFSNKTKVVIGIENTSGCEENAQENHERKLAQYALLCQAIEENGWKVHMFAVEVSARGYCSKSVPFCLKSLGFTATSVRKIVRCLGETAMKSSFAIWIARDN